LEALASCLEDDSRTRMDECVAAFILNSSSSPLSHWVIPEKKEVKGTIDQLEKKEKRRELKKKRTKQNQGQQTRKRKKRGPGRGAGHPFAMEWKKGCG
jgi:hypothetical protein